MLALHLTIGRLKTYSRYQDANPVPLANDLVSASSIPVFIFFKN